VDESWLTPLAECRAARSQGIGVHAVEFIPAGTTVAAFGGNVVERAALDKLDEDLRIHSIQVDDDLFLVSKPPFESADFFNHSCAPNCGIAGSILVVTMRDVESGEELCFDYAMSDTDDYDEFTCNCGSDACRGVVRSDDWRSPEIQARYAGWFSAYIERRLRPR
jgi:hypothetical protein